MDIMEIIPIMKHNISVSSLADAVIASNQAFLIDEKTYISQVYTLLNNIYYITYII